MLDLSIRKRMLETLLIIPYVPGEVEAVTDDSLTAAMTVNENLQTLGYSLTPGDVLRLAVSPSLNDFFTRVQELVPTVKAKPMYPDFPRQMMKLDEAQFRFHQMIHYFSTYGVEMMTGQSVNRGWLPDMNETEKTQSDVRLLEAQTVELVDEADACLLAMKRILGRRERMTLPEKELILLAVKEVPKESLTGFVIPFKENLAALFAGVFTECRGDKAIGILHSVCRHTGDVLENIHRILTLQKYHLKTREKKVLVRLLESYPSWDFTENLMHSRKEREENLLILNHLDYNRFSRSLPHRQAVVDLRDGKLRSWESQADELLKRHDEHAIDFLIQRPGMMLRMLRRVLALGYPSEQVEKALLEHAQEFSTQTLIRVMSSFVAESEDEPLEAQEKKEKEELNQLYEKKRKDLEPEGILNAHLAAVRAREELLADKLAFFNRFAIWQAHHLSEAEEPVWYQKKIDETKEKLEEASAVNPCSAESNRLRMALSEAEKNKEEAIGRASVDALELLENRRVSAMDGHYRWVREQEAKLKEKLASDKTEALAALREEQDREEKEISAKYLRKRHSLDTIQTRREIIRHLLHAHFLTKETPLRGKRIFVDQGPFDLYHSALETNNKSADGTYIRSGLAWKIPEQAEKVRFFVYWNDQQRVDIDLHAAAFAPAPAMPDGSFPLNKLWRIEIGWNSSWNKSGIVFSGDITHSDAAEYIDVDLNGTEAETVTLNIDLFAGKPSFDQVEECYTGLMAVRETGEEVELYSRANCFFSHELKQACQGMHYGFLNIPDRYVRFVGKPNEGGYGNPAPVEESGKLFSIMDYLKVLSDAQEAVLVDGPEDADLVLTVGKASDEREISLADMNYFLDAECAD